MNNSNNHNNIVIIIQEEAATKVLKVQIVLDWERKIEQLLKNHKRSMLVPIIKNNKSLIYFGGIE